MSLFTDVHYNNNLFYTDKNGQCLKPQCYATTDVKSIERILRKKQIIVQNWKIESRDIILLLVQTSFLFIYGTKFLPNLVGFKFCNYCLMTIKIRI